MPEAAPSFRDIQYEFAAHIRDPANSSAPADIEDRRLGIYRDLFYRNVEGFLSNSFPVIRSIIADDSWHRLARHYFANHRARTPLFPKLPQEFLQYLADEAPLDDLPPFIQELAHYEWLELEASLDPREIDKETVERGLACLDGKPVLNPIARLQAYTFPVHRIGPTFQPSEPDPQPTYLVVFRASDDAVGFMQVNPITARLLELVVTDDQRTGRELLEQIALEMQHPDPAVVISGGNEIMSELCSREVLLGARR